MDTQKEQEEQKLQAASAPEDIAEKAPDATAAEPPAEDAEKAPDATAEEPPAEVAEKTPDTTAAEPTAEVAETAPDETGESLAENAEKAPDATAEESAAEDAETAPDATAAEPPAEVAEKAPDATAEPAAEVAETATSGKGNIVAIGLGLLIFFGLLFGMWQMCSRETDHGVLYVKENALYYYDLKNEPYLLQDSISDGGFYRYAYSAWGAKQAEKGNFVYYPAQIQENGSFTLYRRDVSSPAGKEVLVGEDVYDYQISEDGRVAAYLVMPEDAEAMQLCVFDGQESRVIAENLAWQQNLYELRADGQYVVYYDAYNMLCAQRVDGDKGIAVLTDAAAMTALAQESGILYYVAQNGEQYDIYSYDFQNDAVLLAENVTYMEVMPNDRDLLYCKAPKEQVLYRDIVTDDMAESDAALQEGEEGYEAKLQRDEIRAAMEADEGFAPILQEAYVYTGGRSVRVAENVISVAAVEQDMPFVTGYQINGFEPLLLSEIDGGLDTLEIYYYLALGYCDMETFLADTFGTCEILSGYQIAPESIQISADGKKAAYLATDEALGGNILMKMELGKAADAVELARDIEEFAFFGEEICYAYSENGVNFLQLGEENIANVTMVYFDKEEGVVTFLTNVDAETGLGEMQIWNGKAAPESIASDICAYENMGGGKLTLIGDYDLTTETGNLYYFDGKGVNALDAGITAIFME